jgi:polyhydroxyalkanoate synthesis regulator phasin
MAGSKSSSPSAPTQAPTGSKQASAGAGQSSRRAERREQSRSANGLASLVEQLTNTVIKPLDLVMLSRARIQDTLDEAAERGRLTRSDANDVVSELVRRGREQTDNVLADIERMLERGRGQLESATKRTRLAEPVERLVKSAGRVRRTVGVEPSLPILAYDDLTARQAAERLKGLTPAELRTVRDYERRHANRKSVLTAVERALNR